MTEQPMTDEEREAVKQARENPPKHELGPDDADAERAEHFAQEARDAAIVREHGHQVIVDPDAPPPM